MVSRPAWFDACIIGAVFSTILIPASASNGFLWFIMNVAAVAMFVVPMVWAVRDKELDG